MPVRNLLLAAFCTALLASCSSGSDVRETLGLSRKAPDEFRVYARPPLTVPPEFSLRAPGSATDAPTATPADAQARGAVLGTADTAVRPVTAHDLPSGADEQFLRNAGAHKASPDVRNQIQQDREDGSSAKNSSYLINPAADGEPVVDATKEAARIKENQSQKKSPAEGDTPVIEPKSKGILGTLGDLF